MTAVDRRSALALLGAGAAFPAAAAKPGAVAASAFHHGVASGDPSVRGAVLWTRVTTPGAAAVAVRWFVAGADGGRPIESGTTEARAARDFTVKVEAKRLKPGQDYRYWFEAAGVRSPVGRFRTLPVGKTDALVLAVTSCQLFGNGFFNAHREIAQEPRLDAVLFLGDYIYEYEPRDYGGSNAMKLARIVEPDHEIVTLADYRARHASYKRDANLQAAHARAAWICVWDDHESANDSWTGGAQNHQPATEGDWKARKAAAMQAYFEWMPIRDPVPGRPWEAINRSFDFGDLASLLMVETRLLARSEQADEVVKPTDAASIARVIAERNRPAREMLGEPQRHWLERTLTASVASGRPWQLLGSQVVMARVEGPNLEKQLGPERMRAMLATLQAPIARRVETAQAGYRAGLPYNLDSWDGYPPARERLYESFRAAGSRPIVLSGDSHAFWANELFDAHGALAAAEFGTSAITSPSVGDSLPAIPLGPLLAERNAEVLFCDQRAKGYVRLTLGRDAVRADFIAVPIADERYAPTALASFEVGRETDARIRQLSPA